MHNLFGRAFLICLRSSFALDHVRTYPPDAGPQREKGGMGWRGFLDVLQTKSGCEEDLTLHFHYYEYERTSPEVVIGILCTQLSLYVLRRR